MHKDGTTWVLDVGVVCPGTRRHATADTTPGVAGGGGVRGSGLLRTFSSLSVCPLVPTDWLRQQTYLTTTTQQHLLQSRSAQVVVEVEPVQMQVFFRRVSDLHRHGRL